MHHTPRHSRSGIHYSCTALSAFINETSQQRNFPGINLQTKLCIDLVVLLICSDKSFLISQTICAAHLLQKYVSVPSVVLSLALLMKVLKLGNNVCDPILEVWLVNCGAQIQVFTIEFHRMHTLQNLLIYFNILVINTWKQLK